MPYKHKFIINKKSNYLLANLTRRMILMKILPLIVTLLYVSFAINVQRE
jgi:hypothetical protein